MLAAAVGFGRVRDDRARLGDSGRSTLLAAAVGAVVTVLGTVALGAESGPAAVSYAVAVGAAAVAAERTRSVWPAVVVYAAFDAAVRLAVRVAISTGGTDASLAMPAAILA